MRETATRTRGRAAGKSDSSRENNLQPLQVRYYKQMKQGKSYAINIRWKKAERGLPGKPITIRLLAGGAQVVPTEQTLDPSDPDAKTTFHVTPLGKGVLKPFQLEVLYEGRKVQEMPLGARVASHRWTWFFFAMIFIVPWLLTTYCLPRHNQIARDELEESLNSSFPVYPKEFRDYVPQAEEYLTEVAPTVADGYRVLCDFNKAYPLPYYAMLTFLGLTLVSAFLHRDKGKRRTSKPIPIPKTSSKRVDDDDEDF